MRLSPDDVDALTLGAAVLGTGGGGGPYVGKLALRRHARHVRRRPRERRQV